MGLAWGDIHGKEKVWLLFLYCFRESNTRSLQVVFNELGGIILLPVITII